MDINIRIKEITEEILKLEAELESKKERLKVLIKSRKAYEKLQEKAENIDM